MKSSIPLNDLNLNKKGKVIDIICNDAEKRRFLDLGIIKNTVLSPVLKSPIGTLRAYEIRKTVIAIREENAKKIMVVEL